MHGLVSAAEAVGLTGTPAELSSCGAAKAEVEEQEHLNRVVIKSFEFG